MKVIDVLNRVTALYNDLNYVRLPEIGYLRYLDDAINQVIMARPDANVVYSTIRLQPGTVQTIPSEAYALIDMVRNKKVTLNGQNILFPSYSTPITPQSLSDAGFPSNVQITDASPIFQATRLDFDYFDDWQTSLNNINLDYIHDYALDLKSPRVFWVSPQVGKTVPVYIELAYSAAVPKFSEMTSPLAAIEQMEIPISSIFGPMLISYMLYLCYSIDTTSAVDREVAAMYRAEFYDTLNLDSSSKLAAMPKIE